MVAVEGLIAGPFAEALERNRTRFNALFAQTQLGARRVDGQEFAEVLQRTVRPVVEAVHAGEPGATDRAANELYELALELLSKNLLGPGSRNPAVAEVWRRLLPAIPQFVAQSPKLLAAAVTNAICNIPERSAGLWIEEMVAVSRICWKLGDFLGVGRVLGWKSGLPHHRHAALEECRRLPPDLALAALGAGSTSESIHDLLDRLTADPWLDPRPVSEAVQELRIVQVAGAFRGFGGLFRVPPSVVVVDGQFVAGDDEGMWILSADRFGVAFHRTGVLPVHPSAEERVFSIDKRGKVSTSEGSAQFDELAGASGSASDGTTLAVTLPRSHHIYLVAWQ